MIPHGLVITDIPIVTTTPLPEPNNPIRVLDVLKNRVFPFPKQPDHPLPKPLLDPPKHRPNFPITRQHHQMHMLRHHHIRKHIKPQPLPLHLQMLNKQIPRRIIPEQHLPTITREGHKPRLIQVVIPRPTHPTILHHHNKLCPPSTRRAKEEEVLPCPHFNLPGALLLSNLCPPSTRRAKEVVVQPPQHLNTL